VTGRKILRTGLALLAFAPAAGFVLARTGVLRVSGAFDSPPTHVLSVGGAALAAVVAAMLMVYVARRENDARAGLVGVGFLVMAGLLLIHALATPEFILGEYGRNATVGLAGALAVPAGGVVFAVALMLPARRVAAPRLIARSAGAALLTLVILGVIGIDHPELVPIVPVNVTPWSYVLLAPACFVYAWLARRTWHTYQFTRRITDATVAVGLVWLGTSIPVYLLSPVWSWLFWAGHALEASGFLAVALAVSRDLTLRTPTLVLPRQTRAQDLLADESQLLGGYVKSLTDSLHDHDPTTLIHSRKVAQLAVQIGEHLDLPTNALRRLAVAGLLHDIGKLQVPEAILSKPGPLTDDEYHTIQTHPRAGADLLAHLRSFDEEIPVVLAHHERLDGHGYPNGVAGEQIPLEARILSICDVFDALTSPRPYREAWTRERALELIVKETGTAFDPTCTGALLAVVVEGNHTVTDLAA
jgi:HD-GYP domain-containing protein (c-di-GMP phosphodiesterase class II)